MQWSGSVVINLLRQTITFSTSFQGVWVTTVQPTTKYEWCQNTHFIDSHVPSLSCESCCLCSFALIKLVQSWFQIFSTTPWPHLRRSVTQSITGGYVCVCVCVCLSGRKTVIIYVCSVMSDVFSSSSDVNFAVPPSWVCTCLGPPQAITTSPASLACSQQDIRQRRNKERGKESSLAFLLSYLSTGGVRGPSQRRLASSVRHSYIKHHGAWLFLLLAPWIECEKGKTHAHQFRRFISEQMILSFFFFYLEF